MALLSLSLSGLQTGGVTELCGGDREEKKNVEERAKPIDPLLQLITHFSRSAQVERRCVCVRVYCKIFSYLSLLIQPINTGGMWSYRTGVPLGRLVNRTISPKIHILF